MNRLFNIDKLETSSNYIRPQEKKKWNEAFKKFILDEYNENNGQYYDGHCGSRKYCDLCEMKYYNEKMPVISEKMQQYKKLVLDSEYREYFEEKLGKVAFKNAELEQKAFNEKMKTNLTNIKYIDTYSYLTSHSYTTTSDGLHYQNSTSKDIYNYIINNLN